MGAGHSKSKPRTPKVQNTKCPEATGKHTPLPEDARPYVGPVFETLVVSVPVEMNSSFGLGLNSSVSSDVDKYYPMIAGYLGQGFSLSTFYRVPGVSSVSGFGSAKVAYEAVFSRPVGVPIPLRSTRLLVEKSTIHVHLFQGGILNPTSPLRTASDTSDIINKIHHHSSVGGRMICVVMNGEAFNQGTLAAPSTGIGVDVFFEVPAQPSTARYIYQTVNVPVAVVVEGFAGKVRVQCDWFGALSNYLSQGWRLVETFLDQSSMCAGMFSTATNMNCLWFLEKEAPLVNDPTPVYEGTVLEYYHEVSAGFGGTKVKSNLTSVVNEMGRRGWELACIQETPEAAHSGFGKIEMKLVMFFQRKIIYEPTVPPPSYPGTGQPMPVPLPPPTEPLPVEVPSSHQSVPVSEPSSPPPPYPGTK